MPQSLKERRAKRAEGMARWRAAHPEEARQRVRASLAAHPETLARQYHTFLTWKGEHPEEAMIRAQHSQKKWHNKNPGLAALRTKQWRKKNPEKHRINNENRRAREKGALQNDFTGEQWKYAMEYWGGCAVCGRQEGLFWTIAQDHWIPVSSAYFPGNTATNIIPLCHTKKGNHQSCNTTKHNRNPEEWLIIKFGPQKAKRKLKEITQFFDTVKSHRVVELGAVRDMLARRHSL